VSEATLLFAVNRVLSVAGPVSPNPVIIGGPAGQAGIAVGRGVSCQTDNLAPACATVERALNPVSGLVTGVVGPTQVDLAI